MKTTSTLLSTVSFVVLLGTTSCPQLKAVDNDDQPGAGGATTTSISGPNTAVMVEVLDATGAPGVSAASATPPEATTTSPPRGWLSPISWMWGGSPTSPSAGSASTEVSQEQPTSPTRVEAPATAAASSAGAEDGGIEASTTTPAASLVSAAEPTVAVAVAPATATASSAGAEDESRSTLVILRSSLAETNGDGAITIDTKQNKLKVAAEGNAHTVTPKSTVTLFVRGLVTAGAFEVVLVSQDKREIADSKRLFQMGDTQSHIPVFIPEDVTSVQPIVRAAPPNSGARSTFTVRMEIQ